jgi:hypothetical protein
MRFGEMVWVHDPDSSKPDPPLYIIMLKSTTLFGPKIKGLTHCTYGWGHDDKKLKKYKHIRKFQPSQHAPHHRENHTLIELALGVSVHSPGFENT